MLRVSLRSPRVLSHGLIAARAGRQWQAVESSFPIPSTRRTLAENKKSSTNDSTPVVFPGSASSDTNKPSPLGPVNRSSLTGSSTSPATPTSNSSIPPRNVPLPPPPATTRTQTSPPTSTDLPSSPAAKPSSTIPPLPPQPPVRKPRKIIRKVFLALLILSLAGFGGGVYYSRINDNFHDFFTEYVPFGEVAVLYFEEQEFRKRYPRISHRSQKPRHTGEKVTIPSQSGVSWRVAEDDKASNSKHTDAKQQNISNPTKPLHSPMETTSGEQVKSVETVKKKVSPAIIPGPLPNALEPGEEPKPAVESTSKKPNPLNEPSSPSTDTLKFEADEPSTPPTETSPVEPIKVNGDSEPLVQDLAKIINDIIIVINADNSNAKYSSTIGKAKSEITRVVEKVQELKDAATKEADGKIKAAHEEFDRAAKELIQRLEGEMEAQETQWKEEYESERKRLLEAYERKLRAEIDRTNEVNEQRHRNELLEQAVELKRKFIADVKDSVEAERNSRLGKLSDLSNTVKELEKLTSEWNSVIDANLKTQHLLVAVEAVRSHLENAQVPRPFIRELVTLKEIADDDPVVDAAIASINPTAYQRGIPSMAQIIDRFRRVAAEVRKASLLPEDAGVASHASSYLLSKLLFKKKGFADGDDVESVLTRAELFLEEGNLDHAAREMNGLSGWAKTLSKDWLNEVRRVLEVQQALDVIATEARLQSLRVE